MESTRDKFLTLHSIIIIRCAINRRKERYCINDGSLCADAQGLIEHFNSEQ